MHKRFEDEDEDEDEEDDGDLLYEEEPLLLESYEELLPEPYVDPYP